MGWIFVALYALIGVWAVLAAVVTVSVYFDVDPDDSEAPTIWESIRFGLAWPYWLWFAAEHEDRTWDTWEGDDEDAP